MLKVMATLAVRDVWLVGLEGDFSKTEKIIRLIDSFGNSYNVVSMATVRYEDPRDINRKITVAVDTPGLKEGMEVFIAPPV